MYTKLIEELYREFSSQREDGQLSTAVLLEKAAIALEEVDKQARKEINRVPAILRHIQKENNNEMA